MTETPQTTKTPEELFTEGFERYQAGESPASLIPLFKQVCEGAPKNSNAWTSLAWLYLLEDKPSAAHKAVKSAIKLNPHDPQARINLAVAMLALGKKGVREHVEMAEQMIMADSEWLDEVKRNFEDGLKRKPNWKELIRVKKWLFEI
ncbi:MAG: tetratricopeptide repeat protein [Microcoleaceae cyanobacterium]